MAVWRMERADIAGLEGRSLPYTLSAMNKIIARSPYTRMFDPHFHFGLIEQDPDDNKFVDCVIVAEAERRTSDSKKDES